MEVKGIEPLGRRLANVVVGRAADGREASARRPAVADHGDRRDRGAARHRLRRHEHRRRPARPGRAARAPSCRATGASSAPRRWASSATACSARATSSALTVDADGILILPAGHAARRAELTDAVRRRRARRRRQAEPRRRAVDRRAGARGRRRSPARRCASRRPTSSRPGRPIAERLTVDVRGPRPLPALRRPLGRAASRSGRRRTAIQMRLLAAGMRPISNVVDASNYVMVELGKPIHTFDAAAVHDGRIVVRLARGRASASRRSTTSCATCTPRPLAHRRSRRADRRSPGSWAAPLRGRAWRRPTSSSNRPSSTRSASAGRPSATPSAPRPACASRRARSRGSARLGADRTARLIAEWAGGTVAAGRGRHRIRCEPAGRPRRVPAGAGRTGCSGRPSRPTEQREPAGAGRHRDGPRGPGHRRSRSPAGTQAARASSPGDGRGHRRDRPDLAARPRGRGRHHRGDRPRPRLRARPADPPAHADAAVPARPAGGAGRRPRDPRRCRR